MSSEQVETSPELWTAVWQLADVWSETPVVKEFASALPRHHLVRSAAEDVGGVPQLLQELAAVAGSLMHIPLMFGSRIPMILQDPLFATRTATSKIDQRALKAWLQSAGKVETAFRYTLGWLRSSLSGYPILRAPQLAPGTPLTTFELTNHFIWTKDELRSGLNQRPAPPSVSQILGADRPTSISLDEGAREVAARLQESPAWTQFKVTANSLDEDAKVALREARRELTKRLSEESIDEHEEKLALPRSEYRAHTTAEVIGTLTGLARAYADAFGSVHALLSLTMCEVFGELAFYGEPWPIPVSKLGTPEPGQPVVEFDSTVATEFPVSPGQVVWLGSSAVVDAVRIDGISHHFDLVNDTETVLTARVLLGTREAWPVSMATLPDLSHERTKRN